MAWSPPETDPIVGDSKSAWNPPESDPIVKKAVPEAEGNTAGALSKTLSKALNTGFGAAARGLEIFGSYGGTSPGQAPSPELLKEQKRLNEHPEERLKNIQSGPLYQAGKYMQETGEQLDTGKPTLIKKAIEAAGGFAPMLAAGPLAPFVAGAQSASSSLDDKLEQYKKAGLSDEEAAKKALNTALLTGGTQAVAWELLPPAIKSVVGKAGYKGTQGVLQFASRRLVGGAEGAALGAGTRALENVTTGQPISTGVGQSATGLGIINSLMPQPGPYRKAPVPEPEAPRQVKGLLTTAPKLVTPEGEVVDSSSLSPKERIEFERLAESQSRQTPSGQQRVTGTVAAGLNLGDTPAKWLFKSQGTYWYKRDGEWRTDAPTKSFNARRLDPNNPAHGGMIDTLEQQLKTANEKELQRQGGKTETQQKIEDITGVSRAQSSIQDVAPDLAMREIWESRENRRFAFPLEKYGPPKGPLSMSQQDYLKAFSNFARTADIGKVQRLHATLSSVPPKNAFENSVLSMLRERLGMQEPPKTPNQLKGGDPNAPQEEQKPGSVPPERGGDGSGGPPPEGGPGSVVPPAAPVGPKPPEAAVSERAQKRTELIADRKKYADLLTELQNLSSQPVEARFSSNIPKQIEAIKNKYGGKPPPVPAWEGEKPNDSWRVTVRDGKIEQIVDKPEGKPGEEVPTVESLKAAGIELPDVSKLETGNYTWKELHEKLAEFAKGTSEQAVEDEIKRWRKLAEEAKAAGRTPTEEENDLAAWRHADQVKRTQANIADPEARAKAVADAQKVIDQMKVKYNEPSGDPGKYLAKKSGEPTLPKPIATDSERLNAGDKVFRTVGGKEEVGMVHQFGGSLQIVGANGEKFGSDLTGWKRDTRIPEPVKAKDYSDSDFQRDLLGAKPLGKSQLGDTPMRRGMGAALEKASPGLQQKGMAAIRDLRDWMASRGIDPDSELAMTDPGYHAIKNIHDTLNEAARIAYRERNLPEGQRSDAGAYATRAIENAAKLKDPTFRAKAEEIAQKLEGYKKEPPPATDFNLKLQPFEWRALWNDAISAAQATVRAGGSTLDGIAAAARLIGARVGKAWNEFNFRKWMGDKFPERSGEEAPPKKDFIKTWITDSVAPSVGKSYDATKAAINLVVDWFSPTSKAASGDLDILMEGKGYKDKLMLRASHALSQAREAMGGMKRKDQIAFVDRVKRGQSQPTPELQATADLLRKWDDRLYALATKYSPDLPYLANHLRVLWKVIPGTAGKSAYEFEQMMSKRPWRGSRGFILRHTLEDMSEGIEKGGVPVTYNPIEMFMLHAQDVSKFVSANRSWENLKESGRATFVERGEHPPEENWARIKDTIAKQYFSTKETRPGEWYVDKPTARLINNYLSRDFVRENAAGRGLLDFKNMSTAIELGASPFHAVFVTNESISSSMAMAIRKGLSGDVRGAGGALWDTASALKGPLANIPGLPNAARDVLESRVARLGRLTSEFAKSPKQFEARYPKEYAWLNKTYPQFKGMVDDLFTGGGMVEMHDDYKIKAAQGFQDAYEKNNYVTATAKAIPALNQWLLKPIFQEYIPRLKLGHFVKEYADALQRRAGDLESGKISRAELARETWAFVDDRFGELNWDNLYWNRTFKSFNQLAFRSVTWKLGNIRGFGKAIRDTGQFFGDAARFKKPTLTNPMAWLFGMAAVTAVQSTIISKIFAGKYPWELAEGGYDLIKNLTFPRVDANDPSQRVSTPTYWKDAVHFIHSPYDYVRSSMTGEWGRLWDIWNNKDFYGTQIYNPDDPFWSRQVDKAIHLVPLPFSISSQLAAERSGASKAVTHLGEAGFTKAPYYMSHTPAELKASELMQAQLPQGARTKENAEKAINVHKAVLAIKRKDMTFKEAVQRGLVDEKHYKQVQAMVRQPYLVTQIKRSSMTPQDALKIWNVSSPAEKKEIRLAVQLKILHSRSLSPKERIELLHELRKNP